MRFLAFEIDQEPLGCFVVALDLAETPAPMYHVVAGFHRFQFGLISLERWGFCDERGNSFGIHDCVCEGLNGRVERTMSSLVKLCVETRVPRASNLCGSRL